MNYEQMTAVFRVEERSVAFVVASLANLAITVSATVLFVVVLEWGATGLVAGNFTGTLCVYVALLAYRREQLGLQFDRSLYREMEKFGLPLVPSALFLWTTNFSDRFFLVKLADAREVGLYSIGVRLASAIVLLLTAFRMAWPAFAYSIEDDREARRTYGFVLTYLLFIACWAALALGLLAPWLVRLLTTPEFYEGSRVVAPLAFASALYAGYVVVAIGIGRARRTQFNWVVTGARSARQRRAQPDPDPALRDDGRGRRHGRRLRDAVRRHDLARAAHLPGAVPVAARRHARGRRGRRSSSPASCSTSRSRARSR